MSKLLRLFSLVPVALCLLPPPAHGQASWAPAAPLSEGAPPAYTSQAWTVRDGLPVNQVNQVYQTPDGYVWLATFDGLVRFDGVRFTVYNAANTPALPSNRIVSIQAGLGSSFWLNTEQDHLVHVEDDRFTSFGQDPQFESAWVVADGDSVLWVATQRGLYRHEAGRLVPFADDVLGERVIRQVLRARSGALWVAAWGEGVWRFDRSGRRFFPTGGAYALYEDDRGGLWATGRGVARLSRGGFEAVGAPPPPSNQSVAPSVFGMRLDPEGAVVLSAATGLFRLDSAGAHALGPTGAIATGYFAHSKGGAFTTCPDGSWWALGGGSVYREGALAFETGAEAGTLYCDREGSIWVPSSDRGLLRFRAAVLRTAGPSGGSPLSNVYGIYEDREGEVWLGARIQGAYRLRGGTVTRWPGDDDGDETTATFLEEPDGTLWVGRHRCSRQTADGGCAAFEREPGLPPQVYAALRTRDGALWFGTSEGAFRLLDGVWTRFTTADGLGNQVVRYLLERRDGTLWVATLGGGIAHFTGRAFAALTEADGLPSDNVRALYEDADAALWIATEDRGLARLDPRTGEVATIRQADGLYDDGLHTVVEDDLGRLWMSTNRGLFWVPRADLDAFARGDLPRVRSRFYTERNGMRNREANGGFQNAVLKASDGRLWFATQDGAVVVDPSGIGQALPAVPVVIEDVTTAEGRVVHHDGTPIALDATERSFSVRYTAPSFAAPERLWFRYRLAGFDADWVEAGPRREAIYINVPPGTYTLSVASSSGGDVWNEEGAPLTIKVAPFFYETWGFLLVCVLAGMAGLGGLYLSRTRALRRRAMSLRSVVEERTRDLRTSRDELRAERDRTAEQADQLRALDRAKSRFFADVSHEFRTPLTLTLGSIQDILDDRRGTLDARDREQLYVALRNGRRLHRLTNQILDLARLEAGHFVVELAPGDLADYLRTLARPFAAAAERAGVAFAVDVPGEGIPVRFDPDHLDKVFANLLSNAVKFTPPGGSVTVTLRVEGGHAVAAVRDTGLGIAPEHLLNVFDRFFQAQKSEMQPGTGIGLALAHEIAELHGATIEGSSVVGEGSVFTVRLPLDAEAADGAVAGDAASPLLPRPAPAGPRAVERGEEAPADALAGEEPLKEEGPFGEDDPLGDEDRTTVLVVDDNADLRAYVRSHLEGRYRVVEAADGEGALAAVRARLPDLVVSDVMMPRLDGFRLLEALRADPETDFLPVILLTARAEAEDRLAGLGLGADDYVTKPFEARELVARVDNLIAQRRRLRERFATGPVRDEERGEERGEEGTPPDVDSADVDSADAALLATVREAVERHLGDEDFGVEALAEAVGQSRSNLHRRLRDAAGESPSDLLRRARIERGAALLRARAGTVSEVAYAAGFKSVSHFSTSFRRLLGLTPTAYIEAHAEGDCEGDHP